MPFLLPRKDLLWFAYPLLFLDSFCAVNIMFQNASQAPLQLVPCLHDGCEEQNQSRKCGQGEPWGKEVTRWASREREGGG